MTPNFSAARIIRQETLVAGMAALMAMAMPIGNPAAALLGDV
jgi:hypothetical protein